MEENYYKKYKMEEAAREGSRVGIILGLCMLCIFLICFGAIFYSGHNNRPANNIESQSMNSSASTAPVKNYNDDMIELISRKTIYDDNRGPVVSIVKDKETSKEYIIFTPSNKEESIQVFPR